MGLAAPLVAEAQPAGKVFRIGWLSANSPANATAKSSLQNFHQGLRDLGYVEGRDFVMQYRFAEGQADRLPGLAADLVRAHVDVIVAGGTEVVPYPDGKGGWSFERSADLAGILTLGTQGERAG
jgi:putative tryptophan/tyrosine transport system substrate-binding protein